MGQTTFQYYQSISDASSLIRKGELSPVELTRACLERIDAFDKKLHAFITFLRDAALKDAERAEREIRGGNYRGLLHGIPIVHKDIVWTKGVRTTAHSSFLRDWIPTESATVFTLLENAGAICLGKTSLHEFAYGSPGPDEAFPAARNPWNLDYAPGSSSSGSAVAVAAGLCMGATGSDTGGSMRHPASVCGIVGMKPTFGRVSVYGVIPLAESLDHVGPMTQTVRDNAIMLQVMAGYDPKDPLSVNRDVPDFQGRIGKSLHGLRIGVPQRFVESHPHDAEVLEAFASAMQVLRELGAEIRPIEPAGLEDASTVTDLILAYEAYQYHKANLALFPEMFGTPFRERALRGAKHTLGDYLAALEKRDRLRAVYAEVFASGIEAIVSPGRERPADTMEHLLANPTAKRGGTYRMYNLTGLPALVMPMGFNSLGLPLSLQIAANNFAEDVIYQVAATYEDMTRWCDRHPSL